MKLIRVCASFGLGIVFVMGSTHCGSSSPSRPIFGARLPSGTDAPVQSDTAGVVTGSFNPNATTAQLLKASAGSNISGVSVAFPTGSLAIATDITMREGMSLDNDLLAGELALDTATVASSGAAVQITSSKPIDLKKPMIVALPLPVGLSLAVNPETLKKLGVVYRIQSQTSGENIIGFKPASELSFDQNNNILYPSLYFGWFQVVSFDREVAATQKLASIPLHNGLEMILKGMALPSCGKADVGRTVYVQELSQFQFCSADGWQVIDLKGTTGATGAAGATGGTGAAGAVGAIGPMGPAGSGMYLFDNGDNSVGFFLSLSGTNALVKMGSTATSDLGFWGVDVHSGKVIPSCATGNCTSPTYYKAASCTGAPYFIEKPMRNSIVQSGTAYFRSTGTESSIGNGPYVSASTGGTCVTTGYGSFNTYGISTSYAIPSGQTAPPYAAPMYVGP